MRELTLERLRERSVIDEDTGCWHFRGARCGGASRVWLPQADAVVTLTMAMGWLIEGQAPAKGMMWVATCGHTDCTNPAHRKRGTKSLLMKVMRPTLEPSHRARIALAHRRRAAGPLTAELRDEILASPDERNIDLAARLGLPPPTISKVRLGKTWAPLPGASVFSANGL